MVCLRRLENLTQCGWRQCRITERNKGIEAIACNLNEATARPAIRSGCQPMNPADNLGQTPWTNRTAAARKTTRCNPSSTFTRASPALVLDRPRVGRRGHCHRPRQQAGCSAGAPAEPKAQRRLGEAKGLVRIAAALDTLPDGMLEHLR
jgi:hypothetical protein